jgi:hypothetical protein
VGIALVLALAVPVVGAAMTFGEWGSRVSAPADGAEPSPYDGLGLVLGYLASTLVALVLAACLGIAALVLDVLVAIRGFELRSGRRRPPAQGAVPLLLALLGGTGIVSTPVLVVLAFFPAQVLGPGEAANAMLMVLLGLAFVVPLMCRLLMIAFSRELAVVEAPTGHRAPHRMITSDSRSASDRGPAAPVRSRPRESSGSDPSSRGSGTS